MPRALMVARCIEICKACDHSTVELVDAKTLDSETKIKRLVVITLNVLGNTLNVLGIKALRCDKCGCYVHAKSTLASVKDGIGCPLSKWPMDVHGGSGGNGKPCKGCGDKHADN